MPSTFAEPTIAELLEAFGDGIRTKHDRFVDARDGAAFQHWGGVAAILWSRNARRDTDLWRAIYFDSAEGKDLTNLLEDRYSFERIPDAYGVGTARLRRPTVGAGGGTVWRGTHLEVYGLGLESKQYVVLANKDVGASVDVVDVDIRAGTIGPGTAINVGMSAVRVADPLWDTTWIVESLVCGDGTSFEPAPKARARLRESRRAVRPGFVEAIVAACKEVGAENAVLFPSDFGGDDVDYGLNMAYVGDAGFQGDDALCRKVILALESKRVLGDQLQVRPLVRTNVRFRARVHLWDSPARVAQPDVLARLTGAIKGYFVGETNGFSYDRDAMSGALMKASPEVQFVEIDEPTSDASVLSIIGEALNFPTELSRFFLSPNDITIELLPPL